ncbi:putative lysine-specific demethylase JMJ16 isoform X2 [Mercurialis annua]|uniref:putative lysine-specific demethylase JMJ16 isoform X2 n=1 Tax=Mercurialis annua TaxID=3986 RepID=UPI00215FECA3|nr:putative lysine-specific demethylase JMJ16 isoform X2 [Mercurialis annua]XP_050206007.1 putative lysine-specific demethylase JMJ16 isoform X2 [Mercurialis annua]
MGIKRTRTGSPNKNAEKLSVPPGDQIQMDSSFNEIDAESIKRSFKYRPWMLQNRENQVESYSEQVVMDLPCSTSLPRGVAHGCPDCSNCLKVMARWRPEDARRVVLDEAPIFYPTTEEFEDTLTYIEGIRSKVEPCGLCRIVPPPTWNPLCLIKKRNIRETYSFAARIQRIDGLQNHSVQEKNGRVHENGSRKRRNSFRLDSDNALGDGDPDQVGCFDIEGCESDTGPEFTLETFQKYADDFKSQYFCASSKAVGSDVDPTVDQVRWEPSLDDIEGEYRRIVENPTEEIEVLCSGDLDSGIFGSGFPTKSRSLNVPDNHHYITSGWNLNNTPRLPGSLLSFESFNSSGVLVPRIKIGTCFSSFCWKAEEHHLYSLSYVHFGSPKIWYGIPGRYSAKFETVMKKHLPNLSAEQTKLQDRPISKLSISALKSEGIPVYRCIQYPGEFVLVLPGAYYSGFDSGFNCSEAVNIAPIDWLPHGQHVVELYCEKRKKTSISYDKMLLGAAREVVRAQWEMSLLRKVTPEILRWNSASGKDSILVKALKSRIELESNRREYLCNSSQSRRMDQNFDDTIKKECSICFYDLHLSAARCQCSASRYSCLIHSKQLCSCAWREKIFLFRLEIRELNTLLEAVEGKLSAVYKCAREIFELSLFTSISEVTLQTRTHIGDLGLHAKEAEEKEHKSKKAGRPSSTALRIKQELKARMLLSGSLDAQNQKQKSSIPTFAIDETAAGDVLISSSESSSSESLECDISK